MVGLVVAGRGKRVPRPWLRTGAAFFAEEGSLGTQKGAALSHRPSKESFLRPDYAVGASPSFGAASAAGASPAAFFERALGLRGFFAGAASAVSPSALDARGLRARLGLAEVSAGLSAGVFSSAALTRLLGTDTHRGFRRLLRLARGPGLPPRSDGAGRGPGRPLSRGGWKGLHDGAVAIRPQRTPGAIAAVAVMGETAARHPAGPEAPAGAAR
jgi:hypothetical protein